MFEVAVPHEADEAANRHGVEEGIPDEGSPVQMQHLQHTVYSM